MSDNTLLSHLIQEEIKNLGGIIPLEYLHIYLHLTGGPVYAKTIESENKNQLFVYTLDQSSRIVQRIIYEISDDEQTVFQDTRAEFFNFPFCLPAPGTLYETKIDERFIGKKVELKELQVKNDILDEFKKSIKKLGSPLTYPGTCPPHVNPWTLPYPGVGIGGWPQTITGPYIATGPITTTTAVATKNYNYSEVLDQIKKEYADKVETLVGPRFEA